MRWLPLLLINVDALAEALNRAPPEREPGPDPEAGGGGGGDADGVGCSPTVPGLLASFADEDQANGLAGALLAFDVPGRVVPSQSEPTVFGVFVDVQLPDGQRVEPKPAPFPMAGETVGAYVARSGVAVAFGADTPKDIDSFRWDPWGKPDGGPVELGRWIPPWSHFTPAPTPGGPDLSA